MLLIGRYDGITVCQMVVVVGPPTKMMKCQLLYIQKTIDDKTAIECEESWPLYWGGLIIEIQYKIKLESLSVKMRS